MNCQPVLEGPSLLLRPAREADRDRLFAVAADPQLWALHPAHDRWQPRVFDTLFDEALAAGGALLVIDKASGTVIGSSQYRPSEHTPGAMEIGWTFLARTHWGGAANRELKRLMVVHALDSVERVVFRVGADNLRSRGAMEKIGGHLTDATQFVDYPDGRRVAHVIYEITRAGFAVGPLAA